MKLLVTFLLVFFSLSGICQDISNSSNSTLKNKQRSLLIYNFAQQVSWRNINDINKFKIGVFGDQGLVDELKIIAEKRMIHDKKIEASLITSISDVSQYSLVYLHGRYNYDIKKVLRNIKGEHVLVISENYTYNASMINIVNSFNGFHYEINKSKLKDEDFRYTQKLVANSINSEEKWQQLFVRAERTLGREREKTEEQKKKLEQQNKILSKQKTISKEQSRKIEAQEKIIVQQFQAIDTTRTELNKMVSITENTQKELKNQFKKLDSLQSFISNQESKIGIQNNEIEKKEIFIKDQIEQIEAQKAILKDQRLEINTKQNQVFFILLMATAFLIVGFSLYRSNNEKKQLNKQLIQKNIAIEEKTRTLEAQNVEMEQFAYIASHDLQEPLNTISSFIALISSDYKDTFDDVGKQSINYIELASARMKVLITSLLKYSRLGRTKELKAINTQYVINNIKEDLNELITKTETKIEFKKLPVIYGNKLEIRLLFQNLFTNAIKFIPKDRTPDIKINSEKITKIIEENVTKSFYKFSVADNGIGIKEEHVIKIFAIFQRLHNKEEYQGTGIGLAHCKKIVETHGGEIGVTSKFGEGSTFWFTIPC